MSDDYEKWCNIIAATPSPKPVEQPPGEIERLPKSLLKISKAQHLRDVANDCRISAGILNECATLVEDVELLLGRLAECFDEQESEFRDISEMRGRIRGDLIAPARSADEPGEIERLQKLLLDQTKLNTRMWQEGYDSHKREVEVSRNEIPSTTERS